ncbi:CCA tRNA nucleotidyltransferase [Oceanobacillus kapialis]|uniref:CCA-adding enzyme n=1 Tax=Oceanobacillus kapialis TaxID=481353 RepID=A0ABW5Q5F1_9BACI
MLDHPFKEATAIIENIENNGHEAYFVGGCVRDFLLGREIRDVDIATSATPTFIQKIFEKVIPVGIEHGTVIVRHLHTSYEITTFRIDGAYSDQRHPDQVSFINKIDKDLERRDFTINAMAMDKQGKIIDLFDGRKDIANRIIRTVGNGYDRFREDALRMIRAVRFASQLGFSLDLETKEQINTLKHEVNKLAVERISNEMEKFFAGTYVSKAFEELKTTELVYQLPVFKEHSDLIKRLPREQSPLHSLAEVFAFFHLLKQEITIQYWIKAWKASNQTKQEATLLIRAVINYRTYDLNDWTIYQLPRHLYGAFRRLLKALLEKRPSYEEIERIATDLPIKTRNQLQLNGNDVVGQFPGVDKGPWIQKRLHEMEYLVVMRELPNDKDRLKEWLQSNPPGAN